MPRTFKVTSAAMPKLLDLPALEFASLTGSEGLSQVFQYSVTMALDGGGERHITGLVTRARFVQSQEAR